MSETIVTLEVVDRTALPEEISDYELFGKNEQGRFGGFREGEFKVIQGVGDVLGNALLKLGAVKETEPEPEPPEMTALRSRVQELEETLEAERQSHARQIDDLRAEFENQLKDRDREIDDLREAVGRLDDNLRRRGLINGEVPAGDEPPLVSKGRTIGRGTLEDGVWVKRPGPAEPRLVEEPPVRVRVAQSPIAESPAPPRQERRLVEPAPRARLDSETVVVEDEQWYRGRPAAAILGGLAVAAASIAAGFGIWNHHELEELEHRPAVTKVVQDVHPPAAFTIPDNGYATPAVLTANGYHLAFYNQQRGRKVTGVWVPKDVNLIGSKGNYKLVKDGKVLVQKAMWDSQGKLSRSTMDELRKKTEKIGWSYLKGDRKVSIVVNR